LRFLFTVPFLAAVLYAVCPLGFTPEQACSAESPSCALFTDADGDGFCDNPGPRVQEVSEEPEVIDPMEVSEPDTPEEPPPQIICPFGLTPPEACSSSSPQCALFRDANGDDLCDNPGPQPIADEAEQVSTGETEQVQTAEAEEVQEIQEEIAEEEDTVQAEATDLLIVEPPLGNTTDEPSAEVETVNSYTCPLGFTPEEACFEESPSCALYTDADSNGRCDNPGIVCAVEDTTCGLETPSIIACPLGLPPEGACPDTMALCPHWYGLTSHITCANPAGGKRRVNIILLTLAVLLSVSTFLSRKFYGLRLKDRLNRNTAHHVVRGVSLMVLGFGVQGCFCPLGVFQYLFTPLGIAFLGLSGVIILLLPFVFSAFFGRIFCGWVCPIGGIQEFLYRIHFPGRFSPSGRIHRKLRYLSYIILFALIGVILLNRFGIMSL